MLLDIVCCWLSPSWPSTVPSECKDFWFIILFLSVLDETPIIPFSWHTLFLPFTPSLFPFFIPSIHSCTIPENKNGEEREVFTVHTCHIWWLLCLSIVPIFGNHHLSLVFLFSYLSFLCSLMSPCNCFHALALLIIPFSFPPPLYLY